MKYQHVARRLFTTASTFALASLANAQAPAADEGLALEEVVITGSRIISNGDDMPTPVTIVSTEQLLDTTPSTVTAALQQLPSFAGMRSPTTNPGNSSQNNAARVLNLRNMGITRTLVLFDGMRVPPTSPLGEVNADFVPSMLLQRVDIVTGGASAVYGSDAITGVVNFVTDRNFNGIKVDGHYGISERGDGEEYKFGIAGGMDLFDGRGHIEGSYEYFDSPGIFTKADREWGRSVWTVQGNGGTIPYRLVKNTRLTSTSFFGLITANSGTDNQGNPLRDQVFRTNGVLSPFQHGTRITEGANTVAGVESGGDGGYFYNASLQALYQSDLLFGRFDFDLTDRTHLYAQVTGMETHNKNNHETNEFRNIRMSADNGFLAPQYRGAPNMGGLTVFNFSKMITQAPPKQVETFTKGYMANIGLEGELGDWRWDASYLNSSNEQNTRNNANPNNEKAFAALDAVLVTAANVGTSGQAIGSIVCNVTLTNPGLYPGCVPLNLFGPTSESQAALGYYLETTEFTAQTSMDQVAASIAGSPFASWAGDIQTAFSAEYRKLTYENISAAGDNKANCTGLRFNCTQGTTAKWQSNVLLARSPVSQTVSEAAIEVDVPLLSDLTMVQALNLSGAFRYTDYDTSGSVDTWKLGLDWDVNDQLSVRATRSKDIRAPNLNELFAPRLTNPAGASDLHIPGSAVYQAPFITDPNPALEPEVAAVWTAGIVYKPLANLSFALDWYSIDIDNAIANVQGQNPTVQGFCEASNGTSPFCALIERPLPFSNRTPANLATAFYSQPQNVATLKTEGVDLEVNYSTPLLDGRFAVRGLIAYQPDLIQTTLPGAPPLDSADAAVGGAGGISKLRTSVFLKYEINNFSVDILQRWNKGMKAWNADRTLKYAEPPLPDMYYTNLTLGYDWRQFDFFFSVQNLFDKQPTPWGNVGGSSAVPGLFGGYIPGEDLVGRYYTAGFRFRM